MNAILRGRRTLALEMIAVQDDAFSGSLDALHEMLRTKIQDGTYTTGPQQNDSDEVKAINKLIFDRIKMQVFVTWSKDMAAVLPFYINGKSIFNRYAPVPEVLDVGQAQKIREFKSGQKGYVDEAKVKIGGIFSEYETYIFMDYLNLFSKQGENMTAREASAILVHELGHAFYIYAYSDRISRTNQVLSGILDELKSNGKKANREYVYRELKTIDDKVTQAEVDELVDGKSIVGGYRWYLRMVEAAGKTPSSLVNSKYDDTTFEMLADNFASRFGYGRELVGALDKMYANHKYPEKNIFTAIFVTLTELIYLNIVLSQILGIIFAIPVLIVKSPVILALGLYIAYLRLLSLYQLGDVTRDMTYDEVKDRHKRIRQDLVAQLKDASLDGQLKNNIIHAIHAVDQIIDNTREVLHPARIVSNLIFTNNRSTKKNILEQQLAEELANNDLFLKSAQLSTVQ